MSKNGYESWNTGEQAIRILKPLENYSFLFKIFDKSLKNNMINDAIAQFELYIGETNATIIDSSGIDVNNIVSDFFADKPPFESRKEKKNEFPDAFMMAKIKLFAKQHGEIHIISDDNAFKSLRNNSTINVFDNLHDFFVFINPYEDWIPRVQLYFNENGYDDKIKSLIEDKIFDNNPHVDGFDYDRKGIVDGFDYDETEITKINDIKEASVECVGENSASRKPWLNN